MKKYIEAAKSLPHARGGVSHSTPALHADAGSLPHARGGVSFGAVEADPATVSSPRSWGCFFYLTAQLCYPCRLPHARGGVFLLAFLNNGCFYGYLAYR